MVHESLYEFGGTIGTYVTRYQSIPRSLPGSRHSNSVVFKFQCSSLRLTKGNLKGLGLTGELEWPGTMAGLCQLEIVKLCQLDPPGRRPAS